MGPAVVGTILPRAFDLHVVELPHRRGGQPFIDNGLRHLAVVVIDRFQLDDHVLIGGVVAESIGDTAPRDVLASEGFEIQRPAVFDVDGFGVGPCGAQQDE